MLKSNPIAQANYRDLYEKIEGWAVARNLHFGATFEAQCGKLWEEYGELMKGFNKKRTEDIVDGIGDMAVVAIVMNTICKYANNDDLSFVDPYSYSSDWTFSEDPLEALLSITEVIVAENTYGEYYNYDWIIEALDHAATANGLEFTDCLQAAYDTIKDRKGKMIAGVFVKEEDLEPVRI